MVLELKCRFLSVFLLFIWLTAACGPDFDDRNLKGKSAIDAEPVLLKAVEQLKRLESASFSLNHLNGATILIPGVLMTKISLAVSLAVLADDKARCKAKWNHFSLIVTLVARE